MIWSLLAQRFRLIMLNILRCLARSKENSCLLFRNKMIMIKMWKTWQQTVPLMVNDYFDQSDQFYIDFVQCITADLYFRNFPYSSKYSQLLLKITGFSRFYQTNVNQGGCIFRSVSIFARNVKYVKRREHTVEMQMCESIKTSSSMWSVRG